MAVLNVSLSTDKWIDRSMVNRIEKVKVHINWDPPTIGISTISWDPWRWKQFITQCLCKPVVQQFGFLHWTSFGYDCKAFEKWPIDIATKTQNRWPLGTCPVIDLEICPDNVCWWWENLQHKKPSHASACGLWRGHVFFNNMLSEFRTCTICFQKKLSFQIPNLP